MVSITFILAIIFGLISYAAYNLGFALEKEVVDKIDEKDKKPFSKYLLRLLKEKRWLAGLFLTFLSVPFYYIALIWVPLVAISPLSGFGLVVLAIYAHVKVKEKISVVELSAIVSAIIGISLSSIITSKYSITITHDEWTNSVISLKGLFLGISVLISFLLCALVSIFSKKNNLKLISLALISGLSAGIQAIIVKGIGSLIYDYGLTNVFLLFVYLALLIITAAISTLVLQIAFKYGKVSTSMAIYNGLVTILPICFAGILLNEWRPIPLLSKFILAIAISLTVFAIVLLSLSHLKHNNSEEKTKKK
ncbi:MAG: hypothetical protein K9W45_00360 [Candidatus Heimdallarchaeum aukensis]|uniref:Uncharacterized protein n=1 Tax=Candidatus Heimdallarchaeum aukensis TaxID=2876573 RepID=A0A9Y1BL91_9ARCH|nr:MAG: hypothetical protein K9W45_00360 [Candidatus Heimdallarchaeum aukensis]